jgi:hypothetical protein
MFNYMCASPSLLASRVLGTKRRHQSCGKRTASSAAGRGHWARFLQSKWMRALALLTHRVSILAAEHARDPKPCFDFLIGPVVASSRLVPKEMGEKMRQTTGNP